MDWTTTNVIRRDGEQLVTQPGSTTSAGAVISRIESILESVLDCVAEGKELLIDFATGREDQTTQKIHFPGKCLREATKFVDYDPDGLNIFRCYRFRSNNAIQETDATAPSIRWLGIKSQDLLEYETYLNSSIRHSSASQQLANSQSSEESNSSKTSISSTECRNPVSFLSTRDRKVAVGILEKLLDVKDDAEVVEAQRELQVMLMMGVKAEIQWLDEAGNLTDWLDFKLGRLLL
ncbi:hypothetical protein ACSS6W_008933 [Trichoderma asperelloides]